ncbi:MAG: response regulator [Candidatus Competibacteraceae bacterium]|nr:response regulator [Candidatus Competibacteraceae bacterium]MCP5134600.1 response regulator [Gammaproteobacteria bacterium]
MSEHPSLKRSLTWLAGALAMIVTLAPPAVFFLLSYQNRSGALQSEVRIAATAVTEYINRNAGLWRFEFERLYDVLRKYISPEHGATVADLNGKSIARLALPEPATLLLSHTYPIYDFGAQIGTLEVAAPLKGLMVETAIVALGSFTLGLIVFFPLRLIPMHALRQATQALINSENAYRQLVELSPDAIYINCDEKIAYINAAGVRLFGANSPAALLGMSFWDRLHPDCHEMVRERLQQIHMMKKAVPLLEERYVRLDGTVFPVEVAAAPFMYQGKLALQVVAHDLTERKRVEEELRQTRDAAETASRTKSQFLANMSHEIRTPMNGVLGMAQLLAEQTRLTGQQRYYLGVLQDSGKTLLRIIDEILDFSKIEAGKLTLCETTFDMRQRIAETLQMLALQAQSKHLELTWHVDAAIPARLYGDPGRLHQILANLVSNAIKFTEQGSVRVDVIRSDMKESNPSGTDSCRLRFTVHDTGIGISAEARTHLFQPFSQADGSTTRKYGGTGLGLVISKQIVKMMGGEIDFESTPGEGTVFWFTINLAIVLGDPKSSSIKPAEAQPLAGHVLLAEDNPVNRLVAEEILKSLGLEVEAVTNGLETVDACGKYQFDLVLMDCQMPKMDGFEATAVIRSREAAQSHHATPRHIPIIALTANALSGDRERCLTAGMDDYLSKPFSRDDLYQTLKRWVPHK